MIIQEFRLFQHRGIDETSASIEKRWKNLKSPSGKYNKDFWFPKFKPSKKNLCEELVKVEMEIYEENQEAQRALFASNFELIGKIKVSEVLSSSAKPKVAAEVSIEIEEANNSRQNIRDIRLVRFEKLAESDQKFQQASLKGIEELQKSVVESRESKQQLLLLLERLVTAVEKQNK